VAYLVVPFVVLGHVDIVDEDDHLLAAGWPVHADALVHEGLDRALEDDGGRRAREVDHLREASARTPRRHNNMNCGQTWGETHFRKQLCISHHCPHPFVETVPYHALVGSPTRSPGHI